MKYAPSPLRERHNETHAISGAAAELSEFKSGAVNFKLGYWDPRVNGVRYFKALIYNLAAGLSEQNRARLRRIANRDVGGPIVVKYGGETVCMDYLLAVLELDFIAGGGLDLDRKRVLEIGAGYGRTCHAVLSNHDVESYSIVDLPGTLELTRGFLRSVLDDRQFARVRFLAVGDLDALPDAERFDLGLSVNAFAEMPAETVRDYLALIDARSDHLYVRDAVGKYLDTSLDGHSEGSEVVQLALHTGLLQEVVDIHDSEAIEAQARNFVAAYRPAEHWTCAADGWAAPWSFYWQALYRNEHTATSAG